MPSRRQFIQAGLAMSVTPVSLRIHEPIASSPSPAIRADHLLYCLVCDVRSAWSAAVAREAERLGIKVARMSGDITDFWFNDLSRQWKTAPLAIGGLTEHGPLFCLERFGWDHGLRVVFRGTHRELDGGHVEHVVTGPFPTIAAAHTDLAGADWPGRLARLLDSCPAALDASSTTVRGALADGQCLDPHPAQAGHHGYALVSWVIAPKRPTVVRATTDGEKS
jgi:hypothetical protein